MGTFFNPPVKMTAAMQAGIYYARKRRRLKRIQQALTVEPVYGGPLGAWSALTGSSALDTSGAGNSLSVVGSVTSAAAPLLVALGDWEVTGPDSMVFDGTTGLLQAPGPLAAFNFGIADFTINFWMNPVSPWGVSENTVGLIGQKALDAYGGWQIYQDSGSPGTPRLRVAETGGANATDITSTISVPTGSWTMVTAMRESGVFSWSIGGEPAGSIEASVNIMTDNESGANFQIGFASTWSAFYAGAFWGISIFPRAITPDELNELLNSPPDPNT